MYTKTLDKVTRADGWTNHSSNGDWQVFVEFGGDSIAVNRNSRVSTNIPDHMIMNKQGFYSILAIFEMLCEYHQVDFNAVLLKLKTYFGKQISDDQLKEGDVNEISLDLFNRATDITRARGQDSRTENLGSTFFREFVGKPLLGGTIKLVTVFKPKSAPLSNDVAIVYHLPARSHGMGSRPAEDQNIYYDVKNDTYGTGDMPISRADARMLSRIAIKANPNTQYKNGTGDFRIKEYGM
jgi:hypothetical protein